MRLWIGASLDILLDRRILWYAILDRILQAILQQRFSVHVAYVGVMNELIL